MKSDYISWCMGAYLRRIREDKNLSLKDVEKKLDMSDSWLGQLELGLNKRLPTPRTLKRLARYYRIPVDDLVKRAGYYDGFDDYVAQLNSDFFMIVKDKKMKEYFSDCIEVLDLSKIDIPTRELIAAMYRKFIMPAETTNVPTEQEAEIS